MDEFTSIAMWIMIAFLMVNTTIVWFGNSATFQEYDIGVGGVTQSTVFGQQDMNTLQNNFENNDCATITGTVLDYAPCFIGQIVNPLKALGGVATFASKIFSVLFGFLTAWVGVLNLILDAIPAGDLFKSILIPFFGIVEFMALFVLILRIAGIIRGGS